MASSLADILMFSLHSAIFSRRATVFFLNAPPPPRSRLSFSQLINCIGFPVGPTNSLIKVHLDLTRAHFHSLVPVNLDFALLVACLFGPASPTVRLRRCHGPVPVTHTQSIHQACRHSRPFCVGLPSAVRTSQSSLPTAVGAQKRPHGSRSRLTRSNRGYMSRP